MANPKYNAIKEILSDLSPEDLAAIYRQLSRSLGSEQQFVEEAGAAKKALSVFLGLVIEISTPPEQGGCLGGKPKE